MSVIEHVDVHAGLAAPEAEARADRLPRPKAATRSVGRIVATNTFTIFNAILAGFGVLTLIYGDARDALFLAILVINTAIGIAQELRAKWTLDRLAATVAPRARVVRSGTEREVPASRVVVDDVIRLRAGEQVPADGVLLEVSALRLDESALTGEAESVAREQGEEVRSGTYVTEGSAVMLARAVGEDAYARALVRTAQGGAPQRSPLQRAIDRLLLWLVVALVPLSAVLIYALHRRGLSLHEDVTTATAAITSLIPEGLVLLASVTYAVGAARIARQGALARQLNAVEHLASVDAICLDKTGTLTEATLRVVDWLPAAGVGAHELRSAAGRLAAATGAANGTILALRAGAPAAGEEPSDAVPFSSARRWSAVALPDATLVLCSPDRLQLDAASTAAAAEQAAAGRRVVAIGAAATVAALDPDDIGSLGRVRALGLVVLAEDLRPSIREAVAYLHEQGVELWVLSGDDPVTVAAIAADAGIPQPGGPLDGRALPEDDEALAALLVDHRVVGRITPDGKRRVVRLLQSQGRHVAMTGDGVNDVPALKAADVAIVQGTGTEMAKGVADLVLTAGDFAVVPPMVDQGRLVLRNLQRVARLYVTKSAFAAFLILTIGTTTATYPLIPRHLSLAGALTIGIPSFFLALAPSEGPFRVDGFLRDVARFAVPAGFLSGVGLVAAYQFAGDTLRLGVRDAQTTAVLVLVLTGLYIVVALEGGTPRRRTVVGALCGTMLALFAAAWSLPGLRAFFDLAAPSTAIVITGIVGALVACAALVLSDIRPGAAGPRAGS